MRYNGFSYLVGEGFRNIFKNKKSTAISVITMICTMFLFGIFFAIGVNINSILEQVQMKQGMEVFIWDEVTDEQKEEFENEIKALDGVNTVTYKNKQQALLESQIYLEKYLKDQENTKNYEQCYQDWKKTYHLSSHRVKQFIQETIFGPDYILKPKMKKL